MNSKIIFSAIILLTLAMISRAQIASGGGFSLEKSVTAGGGGTSSGDGFSLSGTSGQNAAGTNASASPFNQSGGFWTPEQLAPTAAVVSIGGRITASDGRGIRNAIITLTDSNGASRRTQTGSFGYYRFTDVEVGQTYVLTVISKRFVFANPTQIITVNEELSEINFNANEP